MIVGALTHNSVSVAQRLIGVGTARLVVSESLQLADGLRYFAPHYFEDTFFKAKAEGLSENTRYYYAIEKDGQIDTSNIGTFLTPPRPGTQYSFDFWAASCAGNSSSSGYSHNLVSNHPIFSTMRSMNPLFGIHMGDFHYRDINVNDEAVYHKAYDDVMAQSHQANLYKNIPLAYMWDDHDFGPNDSYKDSPGRPAAQAAYRKRVPHYDIKPSGAIYFTFVIGRVRFIVMDLRSEKDIQTKPDNSSKTMLGSEQKQWLKDTLLSSREPLIALVSSSTWIGAPSPGADNWAGYSSERNEIVNFIKDNNIEGRIFIIAGDAHMLAIDNGVNNQRLNGLNCPVFQFAAMDANPSSGTDFPYSYIAHPGGGQFGFVKIRDHGNYISVHGEGRRYDSGSTKIMVQHEFTVPVSDGSVSNSIYYDGDYNPVEVNVKTEDGFKTTKLIP